ncbi:MAG: hypothetical protein J5605_02640 [Bacteroidales bacterium]|nr:hypothetical protein [Bacteroidales bacterium]
MKKLLIFLMMCSVLTIQATAQSYIYTPPVKKQKNTGKQKKQEPAIPFPEQLNLLVDFTDSSENYTLETLDLLDSVYRILLDKTNPRLYAIAIEGFGGDNDDSLTFHRVNNVYNYFLSRAKSPFIVRITSNKIKSSCSGEGEELIKYEVPVDRKYYKMSELPQSRHTFNQTPLNGKVLMTLKNNPEACIGGFADCQVPSRDSLVRGYYSSVLITKGSMLRINNTRDKCPDDLEFSIEEHLNYKEVLERYFLIPHKKHLLIQVGYVVLKSNYKRDTGECISEMPDSIFVRFPITQEQWQNKIRIFGKKYTEKGVEYKSLTTKKMASKVSTAVQAGINVTQLDTIFLGKRIQPDEIDNYFYQIKTNVEEGSFEYNGKYYKAFKVNKNGDYEMKSALQQLFRIELEEEDPIDTDDGKKKNKKNKKYADDEEIE